MNKFYLKQLVNNPSLLKYAILSNPVSKKLTELKHQKSFKDSTTFEEDKLKNYNKARKYGYKKSICLAADSNMYFDMYGKVYLCCYNRKYLIGDTKTEKLTDIWRGEKILNARREFAKNNMVEGCSMCYLNIQKGEYNSAMSSNFDVFSGNNLSYPSRMDFELSNTCNLECIMCNGDFSNLIRKNRENRPPIPLSYSEDFLNQLDEFIPHLQFANFLGGEPQLINIYYKIWEKLVNNSKAIIRVQTNASILNDKFLELIQKSNRFQISVSMDALDNELIYKIRKNIQPSEFQNNLIHLIRMYKDGTIDLNLSVCPMTINRNEILNIITFANQNKVRINFNQVISPYNLSFLSLSEDELNQTLDTYNKFLKENFTSNNDIINDNRKELVNLINHLLSCKERRLQLNQKVVNLSILKLDELKTLYLKKINSESFIILNNQSSEELYKQVMEVVEQEDEDLQFSIILKLLEAPNEYNSRYFDKERSDLHFIYVKNYINYLKESIVQ